MRRGSLNIFLVRHKRREEDLVIELGGKRENVCSLTTNGARPLVVS
jgi:hypothetical protein